MRWLVKYPANLVEDGQELAMTQEHADRLEKENLIHKCQECRHDDAGTYHINPGKTWEEVETSISKAMRG